MRCFDPLTLILKSLLGLMFSAMWSLMAMERVLSVSLVKLWPLGGRLTKPERKRKVILCSSKTFTWPWNSFETKWYHPDGREDQKKEGNISDLVLKEFGTTSSWVISLNVKEAGTAFRIGWMYSVVRKAKEWQWQDYFYQTPVCHLDECTSAVSVDVEGYYSHCWRLHHFCVSHRKSLETSWVLPAMDGRGTMNQTDNRRYSKVWLFRNAGELYLLHQWNNYRIHLECKYIVKISKAWFF